MKRISPLALLFLLEGCSNNSAFEDLVQKHWSSTTEACASNYLTFDDGEVAAHPNGRPLPLWNIKSVRHDWWWRSSDISIHVEPSANLMPGIDRSRPPDLANARDSGDAAVLVNPKRGMANRDPVMSLRRAHADEIRILAGCAQCRATGLLSSIFS